MAHACRALAAIPPPDHHVPAEVAPAPRVRAGGSRSPGRCRGAPPATSAWLGVEHQRKGYGTEARAGLLALAFDHLGAEAARTEVFQHNHASQGVSRKLGYEHDGISVDARGSEALVSDRLRLTRPRWIGRQRPPVPVDGMPACRTVFGF